MQVTEPVTITKSIARITKWKTVNVDDKDSEVVIGEDGVPQTSTPFAVVNIILCGADLKDAGGANVPYSNVYKRFQLIAYDALPSIVLRRNAAPKGVHDEFEVQSIVIEGLYTAITAAYNANVTGTGKTRKRCLAVDEIAVSSQLLCSCLAGA